MNVNKCLMNFHVLSFPKKESTISIQEKFYYFSITYFLNSLLEIKFMNTKICMNIGSYMYTCKFVL